MRRDGVAAGGDAPRAALGGMATTPLTLHRVYPLSDGPWLGHQPPLGLLRIHLHRRLDRRLPADHHTRRPPQERHPLHQVVVSSRVSWSTTTTTRLWLARLDRLELYLHAFMSFVEVNKQSRYNR